MVVRGPCLCCLYEIFGCDGRTHGSVRRLDPREAFGGNEQWTNFLPDAATATAILDRLVHHCQVVVLSGDSYRLREAKGWCSATSPYSAP